MRMRSWKWLLGSVSMAAIVLAVAGGLMVRRATPILKQRLIATLSARFDSRVELESLQVSLLGGLEVRGRGLQIYPTDDVVAAGAGRPLIAIDEFYFQSGLKGLFVKPMRVDVVHVTGMTISIPPREMRLRQEARPRQKEKMTIVVHEIACDHSRLLIEPRMPGKAPKDFELQEIVMNDVGPDAPWQYRATLTNAVPRGDIHAEGTFGPWVNQDPGASSVNGHYRFDHADLNTIKGIGGMLSSVGEFSGELNKIVVDGETKTPDFSLDTANHPVPLETTFHAIVDGTTGDTYLEPVNATLGSTRFTTTGTVINIKGQGHAIDLDVQVPDGRVDDFLRLAVKSQPVVLTGRMEMKTKLHIRPGSERVAEKISMQSSFSLRAIHFNNPEFQDKVDELSLRAQGEPKLAKPGASDVESHMAGWFTMDDGTMRFSRIAYSMPGADVALKGTYSLDGNQFEFFGDIRTNAKLSQMVTSRWKSWALKPVDPFFHKDGAGAEIPVKITGTRSAPKFGLDLHHKAEKAAATAGEPR